MVRRFKARYLVIGIIAVAVVLVVVVLGVVTSLTRTMFYSVVAQAPRVGTTIVAPEQSKAQQALHDAAAMDAAQVAATEFLAAQPTSYWLTPEQDPLNQAGRTVSSLTSQARDQGVSLAITIYGLPERDCGNHSAGGLSESEYPRWVAEIAGALGAAPDVQKIVVLEPDSLALAPECGNLEARATQLRGAVETLAGPNTWIYLDGGHSGWLSADEMASLIDAVGVNDTVRGFATNVSNYKSSYAEFEYAHALSARLGGLHAVIDTSRNGSASAGAEWCNPPGQTVGDPGGTFGDDVVDTNLWIKPPGESDGPCHGGPAAGVWWPEGAVDLTRDAF